MTRLGMDDVHSANTAPLSERTPISLALVGVFFGWLVAALMAYSAFDSRVAVMETQMQQFHGDVQEMKNDIKTLLRSQK